MEKFRSSPPRVERMNNLQRTIMRILTGVIGIPIFFAGKTPGGHGTDGNDQFELKAIGEAVNFAMGVHEGKLEPQKNSEVLYQKRWH